MGEAGRRSRPAVTSASILPSSGEGSAAQGGSNLGGTDNDHDIYHIYAIYRWATGQAGLRYEFDNDAAAGTLTGNQTLTLNGVTLGDYTYAVP